MNGGRIGALTVRIVRTFRHDRRTLGLIVIVPLVVMALIGYMVGDSGKEPVRLGVVPPAITPGGEAAPVLAYQDRLLWGTDMILDDQETEAFIRARIETDFLLLGKRLYVDPQPGKDKSVVEFGLDLPRPVLEKIFYQNPGRILGIH